MRFWLGTHETSWLGRTDVDLFVSHRRLAQRKRLPRALGQWALDSGGFTELSLFGKWETSPTAYVAAVERYAEQIGGLVWAAPQDWMCEPHIIERTGLSVRAHQERTIQSYLDLVGRGPFVPVLQGWTVDDYHAHLAMYADAGIDLAALPLVGIGSVCRRQQMSETADLVIELAAEGIALHGFGMKKAGLDAVGWALASSDSLAWSYRARRAGPQEECSHLTCSSCLRFALRWREQVLDKLVEQQPTLMSSLWPIQPGGMQ